MEILCLYFMTKLAEGQLPELEMVRVECSRTERDSSQVSRNAKNTLRVQRSTRLGERLSRRSFRIYPRSFLRFVKLLNLCHELLHLATKASLREGRCDLGAPILPHPLQLSTV